MFRLLQKHADQAKDSGYSWVVCFICVLIGFFVNGFTQTIGLLYTYLLQEFRSSRAKTVLVASILASVSYISSPLSCMLIKKLKSRKSAFAACVILPVSCLVSSFVTRIELLYVSLGLLYGFGNSLMLNLLFTVLIQYFDKKSTLACGIASAAVPLSPIALTKPMKHLLESYGWRVYLRLLSIPLLLVAFLGFIFFVPKTRRLEASAERRALDQCKMLLRRPEFVIWLVAIFIGRLGADIMTIHQTQFSIEFGISWEKAAMLPLYMGIGNTIGRLALGQLLHFRLLHPITTYQAMMILGGVTALVSTLSSTYTHIVIFSILFMAFDGSIQGLDAIPVLNISGQEAFVEAFGITLLTQGISRLIGPPLLGLIVDKTNDYTMLFYTVGLPLIFGAFALLGLRCIKSGPFGEKEKIVFESGVDDGDLYSNYEKQGMLTERITSL